MPGTDEGGHSPTLLHELLMEARGLGFLGPGPLEPQVRHAEGFVAIARRLSSERLTFSGILEEMKTDLARHYLRDERLQITKIAWLLGYREVSAFTHAFKRWTGTAPRQSRKPGRRPPKEPA